MNTAAPSRAEIRTSSSVPGIQAEIERMIAAGEISGGERINEKLLATRLGVSRTPIREACRSLERIGLLKSVMNRGFFVRELSVKDALDIYDLRTNLFGLAGRLAAERVTEDDIRELEQLYQEMDMAVSEHDGVRFYNLNTEFHQKLVDTSDNGRLAEIWRGLESELQLFRRRGLIHTTSMLSSNREHRSILDALISGGSWQAGRAMERHIAEGKARLLRSLSGTS